jgi:hypothetical protein
MRHLAFLLLLLSPLAYAAGQASTEAADVQREIEYVGNIQRFQGMYDSVVGFCGKHVPAHLLERARSEWLDKNKPYLDLRDKQLGEIMQVAAANGASDEELSKIRSWVQEQYESRLHHDRLYKDLADESDLTIPCSRRLGEMLSSGMSLDVLSPESVEYFNLVSAES